MEPPRHKPTLEELKKYSAANNYPLSDDESDDEFFKPQEVDRKWTDQAERIYQATMGFEYLPMMCHVSDMVSGDFQSKLESERREETRQIISPIIQSMQRARQEEEEIKRLLSQIKKTKLI